MACRAKRVTLGIVIVMTDATIITTATILADGLPETLNPKPRLRLGVQVLGFTAKAQRLLFSSLLVLLVFKVDIVCLAENVLHMSCSIFPALPPDTQNHTDFW